MDSSNNYKNMSANYKEKYGRLKKMIKKGPKAHAEEEASRDPKGFLEKMKSPSIKKLKGIAL